MDVFSSEFWDWFVAFHHPSEIWKNHPSVLIGELTFYLLGLLTLGHAIKQGGRFLWLWLAVLLHSLVVEALCQNLPDISNYWYAQAMITLCGKRLPLHLPIVYVVFHYTAAVAVSRMNLRRWFEPCAVGLAALLMDIPFDLLGAKLLWWTWHDTDPNIYDRHYWAPWTCFYFMAASNSSLSFLFHGTRKLVSSTEKWQADGFFKELLCTLVTGVCTMPLNVVQFMPFYNTLHDLNGVHSEVCALLLFGLYALVVWVGDRHPRDDAKPRSYNKGWFDAVALVVFIHFPLYIYLVITQKPELIRSTSWHETVGRCDALTPVYTPLGKVLSKRSFLCVSEYSEPYDFHCIPNLKPPANGTEWYTICGTPFDNHLEYIVVVTAFCLVGLYVYIQMLAFTGRSAKETKPIKRPYKDKQS